MNTASPQPSSDRASAPAHQSSGQSQGTVKVDGYAGDITPKQAWTKLSEQQNSFLVDVRSSAEWSFVGLSDLTTLGKSTILVSLMTFPGMVPNQNFVKDLNDVLETSGATKDAALLFICRSGQRSITAAQLMTSEGYKHCFNVLEGFEGGLNDKDHRGVIDGWKVLGLPWVQQ